LRNNDSTELVSSIIRLNILLLILEQFNITRMENHYSLHLFMHKKDQN